MIAAKQNGPIVETSPDRNAAPTLTERSLRQRIRQQEILAELGVFALQGAPFLDLLSHTARLTAEGLEAEFCKVLEHRPEDNRLVVRAGVGWEEGIVGSASVGADLESPAGFALRTGKPVISNHLDNEDRFRTPELLVTHGIRRAMNVILQGDGSPFGVLEVDSRSEGEFSERDIAFLQGAANVLGMAIERERYERQLKEANDLQQILLNHQQVLLREINHRAKNSLQLVGSMLHLQASAAGDPQVSERLMEASRRVSAVGRLYDRLSHETDIEEIDLGAYLHDVCKDLAGAGSQCKIHIEVPKGIQFAPERAIHLALIVNELVTNAAKYAQPNNSVRDVWLVVRLEGDAISVSVRDAGIGLPPDFNLEKSKGLGMRIVTALARQLGATLTVQLRSPDSEFTLLVPFQSASQGQVAAITDPEAGYCSDPGVHLSPLL
jgi:two-component sensor histidine kinase